MTRPWRILHLTASVAETSGQYNEHCLPFVGERDLTLCSFHRPAVVPPPEITCFDGGSSSLGYLRALRAALGGARDYDVIHAHAARAGVLFLIANLFRPRNLARSVYTVQNSYWNYRLGTRLLLVPIFAGYRRLVMCSEACRDSLPAWLRRLGGRRIRVVQNAVHVERVRRAVEARPQRRDRKHFVVACVGRVIEIKDPLTVLDAFSRAADPDWRLRFIGDGALRSRVLSEAKARGLGDRVEVTGLISRDRVFEALGAADVFVSASKGEGLPVAVLEGLASGRPSVLSDIPPHRELVNGAEFIPLVECGDAAGFARELRRLHAATPAARRGIATRCRNHVERHFGLPVMHSAYERVYEEVRPKPAGAGAGHSAVAAPAVPLSTSLRLFRALDEAAVGYCHFKSNEHLAEGLAGITDLDVLVERRHAAAAQSVLLEAGFKRVQSKLAAAYPAVEDYLGFDPDTARLIHVHVHYALVAGEPHLKSYQLRLGDAILSSRVRDADTGVYVTEPNFEMELLLVRCALKLRWRDHVLELLGRPYLRGSLLREYHWLMQRIDPARVCAQTAKTLGPAASAALEPLLDQTPTIRGFRRLRARAMASLADQRSHGPVVALALRTAREAVWWFSAVSRRLLGLPIATRRAVPSGGMVVTFLGPDGCGKSTIAREIRAWLGWKLDVYSVYFGSGDGRVSLQRWPLKLALGLYRRLRPLASGRGPWSADATNIASRTGTWRGGAAKLRWIWALSLALEKRASMRSLVRARNRGMVVVCDRYPQIQVMGFNDGPLLGEWLDRPRGWRRRVAAWEYRVYRDLVRNAPDLAFKLRVSPEMASRRKPEVSRAEVERRLKALEQIDYGERCDAVDLDADRALPQVLAEIKRVIWERL
ncbi:MAG: glycosyltransferase [Deltaproteobacteria bacterium]|nr:MAG: glycosyltransferase [Deltaproteobacteria bacterium]